MPRCHRPKCNHCLYVIALTGHEGETLQTSEIKKKFVKAGGTPGSHLPNDHARRKDGQDWCRPCPRGDGGDSPTHGIGCNGDCHHKASHIFWSMRECIGTGPDHTHDKPGDYEVVKQLHWCDGEPV